MRDSTRKTLLGAATAAACVCTAALIFLPVAASAGSQVGITCPAAEISTPCDLLTANTISPPRVR